jgi:DNA-binding protein YbaB
VVERINHLMEDKMTKEQEIKILKESIEKLGLESYLGPWLESVLIEVERDVRSDIYPSASITETRKGCETLIAEATTEANRIVTEANRKAENTITQAFNRANGILSSTRENLRQALNELGR